MGKKTDKKKKMKDKMKQDRKRNEQERRFETLNIIYQLKQNNITSKYPAIRTLLELMNTYVIYGDRIEVNIPFPEMKKRIKGVLASHKYEEVVVVLKHDE